VIRLILTAVLVLISSAATALDGVSLDVGTIESSGWKLQGIQIALTDLANNPQKLTLSINKLSLPLPFDDLNLINIHCSSFTWKNKELLCTQGRAQVRSKRWQSPAANFSFYVRENHNTLKLTDLLFAGGTISIDAEELGNQWQIQVNAKGLDSTLIQKLVQPALFELKAGRISLKLNASGSHALIEAFTLITDLNDLTVQTKDGRFATEKLTLESKLEAQNNKDLWQWQSHSSFKSGALYFEPLYLEADGQAMILDAQGNWSEKNKRAEIKSASYKHATALTLSGSAIVQYADKSVKLEKADLSLRSNDLQKLSALYLKSFFEQTVLQGITFAGSVNANLSIAQNALTALTATVNKLGVKDTEERIKVEGGAGTVNWSSDETFNQPSTFTWQHLEIIALPIGPSRLSFLSRAGSFKLLEKTQLPFLGGVIAINQLGWQAKNQQEPEVYFAGSLNNVSLEQWSKALNWTPLSGTITGNIPRVEYRNNTLSLGGEINIKVFDGDIRITQLASSGLFTNFPRVSGELEINNLDLDQLTGKFKFGGITGRLSGFVRQLTMENWQPVTFYAWLGTPDEDDSRHRISQKAVKNIASIGGGGASDLLSKSFLSFFETFGYDKIGLGCYLHDGVCQLMGVEATPQGYAIVTGGGLPRIDVIGYNPRLDWNVLMERLHRISSSDEVIIK
jgi:hypothetical protein